MTGAIAGKLDAMQTIADVSSTPAEASFSSLLTALTSRLPAQNAQDSENLLRDDVVSLSYEQALRTAARHRSPASHAAAQHLPEAERVPPTPQAVQTTKTQASHRRSRHAIRMASSVTIRLDESESAELRARAAEAGLTVSAYLRSCIFEVEDLRAQVKQALAQMRSTCAPPASAPPMPLQAPSPGWRERIFPRWMAHGSAAHA